MLSVDYCLVYILQVTPPKTREQKDLFVLLEKNLSSFEAHLNSMNPNKALQLMTAMLLTVESQESANSGSSNSTVSTKQRTNVSHFAVTCLEGNARFP